MTFFLKYGLMKKIVFSLAVLCFVQYFAFGQFDDIYYEPSTDVVVYNSWSKDKENQEPSYSTTEERDGQTHITNNYYSDNYYYTSRMRKYQRPFRNNNYYYSPYFSPYYDSPFYSGWNADPYWGGGTTIIINNGWGWNSWNNGWGWNNWNNPWGWNNWNPYYGYNNWGYPYGYDRWYWNHWGNWYGGGWYNNGWGYCGNNWSGNNNWNRNPSIYEPVNTHYGPRRSGGITTPPNPKDVRGGGRVITPPSTTKPIEKTAEVRGESAPKYNRGIRITNDNTNGTNTPATENPRRETRPTRINNDKPASHDNPFLPQRTNEQPRNNSTFDSPRQDSPREESSPRRNRSFDSTPSRSSEPQRGNESQPSQPRRSFDSTPSRSQESQRSFDSQPSRSQPSYSPPSRSESSPSPRSSGSGSGRRGGK